MNVVHHRGNGNKQGYRKLKKKNTVQMKAFSHSDPNIRAEDDTQLEGIKVAETYC
jgi:hypothetical protein